MKLDKKDRLIMHNQFEILKRLYPDDAEYYEKNQEILVSGFEFNYPDLFDFIGDVTPSNVSEFVLDVLNMYRSLNFSYDRLNDIEKEQIDKYKISFKGFDATGEYKYYNYAKFYIITLDRFEELRESKHFALNYHHSTIDNYKRLLSLWEDVRKDKYDNSLSFEDIKYIIDEK